MCFYFSDYGALLTEDGDYTPEYLVFQEFFRPDAGTRPALQRALGCVETFIWGFYFRLNLNEVVYPSASLSQPIFRNHDWQGSLSIYFHLNSLTLNYALKKKAFTFLKGYKTLISSSSKCLARSQQEIKGSLERTIKLLLNRKIHLDSKNCQ